MSNKKFVVALDQGTTSSRALVFDQDARVVALAQQEFPQLFPQPGHVEHNPEEIWSSQLAVTRQALRSAGVDPQDVAALGITNQRETTLLWERDSGQPVANAIVWQSRVTAGICDRLRAEGWEPLIRERTGLVLDAYFSATKIMHLLDSVNGLRKRAERGEILFGTVDTFLIWRLTGGRVHATDVTNASRTMIYDIHRCQWDDDLLQALDIPRAMLPEVHPSSHLFGVTDPQWFGAEIPIAGCAGDQQAATFGQVCFAPGEAKGTYGTGAFLLMNTGDKAMASQHGLLTTIGWQLGDRITYCLEGAVFVAGAAVQWLRDQLQLVASMGEIEALAASVPDNGGVYFVPAFVGLGAPYWDSQARGAILGLTRGSDHRHLARAALEAMAFQSRDVIEAMQRDCGFELSRLKVDGGASANNLLMQFHSDLLDKPLLRPTNQETTALGAAYLAGLAVGVWSDTDELAAHWHLDRQFDPGMSGERRSHLCGQWAETVRRAKDWER